jgi:membrane-associated phospholipid phosphatase
MSETLQKLNQVDLDLTNRLRLESTRHALWKPAVLLAHSGDSWLWATGVGVVWLSRFFGGISPNTLPGAFDLHRFSAILEISIVFQALAVFLLKNLIRRQRPSGEWGGIYRQVDPHSFPSGHATRAAMLAVLALSLGPAWLGWLLVVWAPLVCIARVMTGVHYVSDIFGGILLGVLTGLLFAAIYPLWMQWFPYLFY